MIIVIAADCVSLATAVVFGAYGTRTGKRQYEEVAGLLIVLTIGAVIGELLMKFGG